jgi:hypothetical protein
MIMYHPGSQQGRSNALSRRSYLASTRGNAAYDQQHLVFLKHEGLLLRTLQTTTSLDPTILKDIHVSLLSDPVALKFKQSCANSRP